MKKVLIPAIVLCLSAMTANAEDVLQVVPFQTTANAGWEDGELDYVTAMEVNLINDPSKPICALQFDICVPEGFTMDLGEGERMPFVKKGKNYTYDHAYTFKLVTSTREGYAQYRVTMADQTDNSPFWSSEEAESDQLCVIYYATDEALATDVYPIYISNVVFTYFDENNVQQKYLANDGASYVVVGTPTNATLALSGEVASFVNEALVDEAAISSLDLTAVTAINGDFTYVDGRAVTAPTADVTVSAKYAKTLAEGKYASLTLPFNANFATETAYKLTEVADGYAMFDAVTSANAGDVVLLTKSVELTGTKLGDVAGAVVPKAYYVSEDGTELRQGTNVNVPALRGVWEITGGSSNLRIMLDGIATDITMAQLEGEGAQAFDLQGRRTANAKNGVYVVNGKKQIVK